MSVLRPHGDNVMCVDPGIHADYSMQGLLLSHHGKYAYSELHLYLLSALERVFWNVLECSVGCSVSSWLTPRSQTKAMTHCI